MGFQHKVLTKLLSKKKRMTEITKCLYLVIIRHSRLPAGNALWFCQNYYYFFLFFLFYFFFFRRQRFRMITFDRQAGPLHNFNRSHVMGRSVSFSDPRDSLVGSWGAPNTPKSPPPSEMFFFSCVSEPQEHF